jgi:hypothetical protein
MMAMTAGCQMFGSDDGGEAVGDAGSLDVMIEESSRLIAELVESQGRLIRDCMEERGHSVHDEYETVMWDFQKQMLPDVDAGSLLGLTDREIAETWGFGVWTSFDDMYGSEEHHAFEAVLYGDDVTTFAMVDNSAFDGLTQDEKFEWYVDYFGEARTRLDHGYLVGDLTASGPGGLVGTVEPEGCMGEVTAALGLEPQFVPEPDFGDDAGTWSTFPPPPGVELLKSGELDEQMRQARTGDEDFLICIEDAGWGQWEFSDAGTLNAKHFIELAYGLTPDPSFPIPEEYTAGVPEELPADVPTDAEGRQVWESGFALDIWECVDQSGLEAEVEQAWEDTYGTELLALEDEIYAWQEDMRDIILEAQDLLGA